MSPRVGSNTPLTGSVVALLAAHERPARWQSVGGQDERDHADDLHDELLEQRDRLQERI